MEGELFRLFVPAQAQQLHLEFNHLICAPLASELPLPPAGSQRANVSSRFADPVLPGGGLTEVRRILRLTRSWHMASRFTVVSVCTGR